MITIDQHSASIASKVVGKFQEMIPVRSGFSQFFPEETTPTLIVDVEVERDNDLISVDVQRFAEGTKNKYTRSTEKKYIPPYFKEDYDFARDEVYMNSVAFGITNSRSANAAIAKNALKGVTNNKKKIIRAIRKQQADVLQTGIVTMKNGDSIDYQRKAASIVDLNTSSVYWSNSGTANPSDDLADCMTFLRNEGNSSGTSINVVMRSDGLNALLACDSMTEILNSRRMDRAKIVMPQFNEASGMAFHGQMAAGDFMVNLWTYNEKYTDADGNNQYYLNNNNAVVLPSDFRGKTVFGGLPFLRQTSIGGTLTDTPGVKEAKYLLRAYSDKKTISSTLELTSAPLVIPFTIDKLYTMKVL